ncbi:MAG: hypothetical protein NT075_09375 [Chloroflexi bacterium]|nr:hypothetical protein [Chloroflexota bacterium]
MGSLHRDKILGTHLSEIAQAAVTAQLDTLTATVKASSVDSGLYIDAVQKQIVDAANRRSFLTDTGVFYNGYDFELLNSTLEISGETAILNATEHTSLIISTSNQDPLAPTTTEYFNKHLFTFSLHNGDWVLVSDQLVDLFGPDNPKPLEEAFPFVDESADFINKLFVLVF